MSKGKQSGGGEVPKINAEVRKLLPKCCKYSCLAFMIRQLGLGEPCGAESSLCLRSNYVAKTNAAINSQHVKCLLGKAAFQRGVLL